MLFSIEINDQTVSAKRGETILTVLNRNGIYVPTLCHMNGFSPTGSCRMCIVEVEGIPGLVPSCSHPVEEWMRIKTHSPRVIRARKALLELLLANHPDDCLYCVRSGNCELQKLADEMNITERRYHGKKQPLQVDKYCPSIERDPAKCILCGRCMRVCDEVIGVSAIDIIGRGSNSRIGTTYNKGLNYDACVKCGQCIICCPTAAIREHSQFHLLLEMLNKQDHYPVIQFSPTVPGSIAEAFGLKTSKDILNLVRAALKKIGFRQVFDTSMAADLNIMEVSKELADRLKSNGPFPLFTSCCPSWVRYVESSRPDLLPHLSQVKSPQQIMGSVIKNYITSSIRFSQDKVHSVSVMPCTAKKYEAVHEHETKGGCAMVDSVLTTRELIQLIRLMGIDFSNLEPEPADTAFSVRSSAGKLYGLAGGVAEGILRTLCYQVHGQELSPIKINELRGPKNRKETLLKMGKQTVKTIAVSGLANAMALLEEIDAGKTHAHLVEVMACPGGCINGGGQCLGADEKVMKARIKAIYDVDDEEIIKVAHKNPIVGELYEKFLGQPGSVRSREMLHISRKSENPE